MRFSIENINNILTALNPLRWVVYSFMIIIGVIYWIGKVLLINDILFIVFKLQFASKEALDLIIKMNTKEVNNRYKRFIWRIAISEAKKVLNK